MSWGTYGVMDAAAASGASSIPVLDQALLEWPDLAPFLAAADKRPMTDLSFLIASLRHKPRSSNLTAAIADGVATSCGIVDGTGLVVGEVIEFATGERAEVTAITITNATTGAATLTIRRGIQGTTGAAQTDAGLVRFIGNSASGAEENRTAASGQARTYTQYVQEFQTPIATASNLQNASNYGMSFGAATPFDAAVQNGIRSTMQDVDTTLVYGIAEAIGGANALNRAKMAGVRALSVAVASGGGKVTSPTNAASYSPPDFLRDFVQTPRENAGVVVDTIVLGMNWVQAFAIWGVAIERLNPDSTALGVNLSVFRSSLGDQDLIFTPNVRNFHGFSFRYSELVVGVKTPMMVERLAKNGRVERAQIVMEASLAVQDAYRLGWVEGVTAFDV